MAVLVGVVSTMVAAQAQGQASAASQLDEGRRALVEARLTATETLQRTGSLTPEQTSSLDPMIKDALHVWTVCVRSEVDRGSVGNLAPGVVVDTAISACSRDKEEVAAWVRLAGQAHIVEMPAATLDNFLRQQEARLRASALEYLASAPGALAPSRGVGGAKGR